MQPIPKNPKRQLNKSYLKIKPGFEEVDTFIDNLRDFIQSISPQESEEHNKEPIRKLLRKTGYKDNYYINSKSNIDLVIHTGASRKSPAGVLMEVKNPSNTAEMVSKNDLNAKAMHELILYYFIERTENDNKNLKNLIITNLYEWFIFDARDFDRVFYRNRRLKNLFLDFKNGRLSSSNRNFFYNDILQPELAEIETDLPFAYIDLAEYKPYFSNIQEHDQELVPLYKTFTPEHLLKVPFINDSNTLNKQFYSELLHILGLQEKQENAKTVIIRKEQDERNRGSLIENTIKQLIKHDEIANLQEPEKYGENENEQLFNVALELVITWVNRILFLKLLESQLIEYHNGDQDYFFLNFDIIREYDDLDELFFSVFAKKMESRDSDIHARFKNLPYLNSSLFDHTPLEIETIYISNLEDRVEIPLFNKTVLDDGRQQNINTLKYLFDFLNAYDFSSASSREGLQEENKTLINASVLGLIFEKINGYKDGSFFTPGYITMYICREILRKAVVKKFNQKWDWNCSNFAELEEDLKEKIKSSDNRQKVREESNQIIDSLKICDPAVGSGHFLVSALNEIIAIKNDLAILSYRDGRRINDYSVEISNDELVIINKMSDDEYLFEYNPGIPDSQKLQEALFHEKKNIIENCLFGVDLNPNSVKICQLRLWIELLKNAYYTAESNFTKLETLPNIDINIKCGDTTISRFDIQDDLKNFIRSRKWNIEGYKLQVMQYKNSTDREDRKEAEKIINEIKASFQHKISSSNPLVKKKRKLEGELYELTKPVKMFDDQKAAEERNARIEELSAEIDEIEAEIEELKMNPVYQRAFEWRYEFPEVLDDNGDFMGFDVVIGNPPYKQISAFKNKPEQDVWPDMNYKTYKKSTNIYSLFYERGVEILKDGGLLGYISSNQWMRAKYGNKLRKYFTEFANPLKIIDFGGFSVFSSATVDTNIIFMEKNENTNSALACRVDNDFSKKTDLEEYFRVNHIVLDDLSEDSWVILSPKKHHLKNKISEKGLPLGKWQIKIRRGILTGYNKAFIISEKLKNELIEKDQKNKEIIKPLLRGRDIEKYGINFQKLWIIATLPARNININDYPEIKKHLRSFGKRIKQTGESYIDSDGVERKTRKKTLNKWYETQDTINYYEDFVKTKIVYPETTVGRSEFYLDRDNFYLDKTCFFITGNHLEYINAILASQVIEYYLEHKVRLLGKRSIQYSKQYIKEVPIPEVPQKIEKIIIDLVNEILSTEDEASGIENLLDLIVYKLYNLNKSEIEIIDPDIDSTLQKFELNFQEYNGLDIPKLAEYPIMNS